MSVFERLDNDNGAKILHAFQEIEYHLEQYLDSVVGTENDIGLLDDPLNRNVSGFLQGFLVKKIPEYKLLVENNIELFENNDFSEILWNELSSLRSIIIYDSNNKLSNIFESVKNFMGKFENIRLSIISLQSANKLISELEKQVEKASGSVKSVISAKEALESKPTEDIYSNAAKKYIKTARFYDVLLLILLGVFYYLTSQFFENFQMISIFKAIQKSSSEAQTLAIFFFITKLTIVSIVITLATIFIRRSSHFRKLHDQANQTSLELNALPNYLRQVDSEHHSEIYKEMIPKFFGNELDQSQNDKVGDLVKDQLAAGTELIKASAEMVKNAKSLGDSADKTKTIKPKNTSTEDKTQSEGEG